MKRLMVAGLFLAISGMARAEYAGNPDRFPSIGVNYTGAFASGDGTVSAGNTTATQDFEIAEGTLALDAKIPVSNSMTVNGAIGFFGQETDATETPVLVGQKLEAGGVFLNVGVRFYIK